MRQWSVNGAEYVFHFVYKLISVLSYGHIFCPAFDPQYFGIPFPIPLPEERQYAADETPLVYIPIRLLLTFKIRSLQPEFLSFKKPKTSAESCKGNLHCGRRGEKGDRGAFK